MNEHSIEKITLGCLLTYEDLVKVVKFFSTHDENGEPLKPEDFKKVSRGPAVARAVHLIGKSVKLTQAELDECENYKKRQREKRMRARAKKNGGTTCF